jgi:hypothetical protein
MVSECVNGWRYWVGWRGAVLVVYHGWSMVGLHGLGLLRGLGMHRSADGLIFQRLLLICA